MAARTHPPVGGPQPATSLSYEQRARAATEAAEMVAATLVDGEYD